MNEASPQNVAILEKALARLEEIMDALEKIPDGDARNLARALMEQTLDLHGLALAQITSVVMTFENGERLMRRLLAAPHIRAILLLHGLHPDDPEQRLRQAIEASRTQWIFHGADVVLVSATPVSARVELRLDGAGGSAEDLRREVEERLVDAAPDLDEIHVDIIRAAPPRRAAPTLTPAPDVQPTRSATG